MALENEDSRIIMSVTGLDAFGALLVALEIDGIGRFESAKNLISWVGLSERAPVRQHHISRQDEERLEQARELDHEQAAKTAARYDKRMSNVYERARKNHPYHVAVSRVATKMLTIV